MEEIDHPPLAPALMDSMRSMGYSLGSALADLIDNSVAANARRVDIQFRTDDPLHIAVIDDGDGMNSRALEEAMRHGSRGPLEHRHDTDLGRFGLGLKTASLSQCARMTVISQARGSSLCAYSWDLDVVKKKRRWILLKLSQSEISKLPHVDRIAPSGKGTVVYWEKLDRLLTGELDLARSLGEKVDEARDHLALVFHRYLVGEPGLRRLAIFINGLPIEGHDPFLLDHALTQKLEDDEFRIEGKRLRVKPFILPHPSRLSPGDAKHAGGQEGLRAHQGFYIYRQKRLIVWGTWFRLARKDELSRLARVRVDIPNSLDHLWTLDIRKSVAHPPEAVRKQLRRTVEKIRERSRVTHVNRGYAERNTSVQRGWIRVFDDGHVRYDINRDHPAIKSLREGLDDSSHKRLESVLRVLETCFPIESMFVDVASEQRVKRTVDAKEILSSIARGLLSGLDPASLARKTLLRNLHAIEPFSAHPNIAREIAEELANESECQAS